MASIPLNKFEKEKRVIELHLEGKTYKEIAKIAHKNFRDISKIIKTYDKKIRVQQTKKEEKNEKTTTKKFSLSTRAFILYSEGKRPIDVAIDLDIPYVKARKFWAQFLNLEKMEECFDLYQNYRYKIPTLLSITNFMDRNNVYGKDIVNVLRIANDINNLNQTYQNLKTEIKDLEQRRNYLLYSPISPYSLEPLPLNKQKYNYYSLDLL
jgi:hypothetical protein